MRLRVVLVSTLILAGLAQSRSGPSVILGVVEDLPGNYADAPRQRSVRVVFKKAGSDWQQYPSDCPDQPCLKNVMAEYPAEVTWTLALDGKQLGQISSRNPAKLEFYSSAGQQEITSGGPLPTVGKRSKEFGTFLTDEAYRPLVAVSRPYFKDPDGWKAGHLSAPQLALVHQQFRKQFPKLCRLDEKGESGVRPYAYRDQDVKPGKVYGSRNGWFIAELHVNAYDCDDERGYPLDNQWFAIGPQRSARYLDEGMWLVDAGDYDNDGKSELLFCIDQYNRGGYKLFYDDFNKRAVFQFHYH